jgi:hypothetical protein
MILIRKIDEKNFIIIRKISLYRKKIKHYNELDGKIDRRSFMGKYEIDKETNRPKNPQGRTGCMSRNSHLFVFENHKINLIFSIRSWFTSSLGTKSCW